MFMLLPSLVFLLSNTLVSPHGLVNDSSQPHVAMRAPKHQSVLGYAEAGSIQVCYPGEGALSVVLLCTSAPAQLLVTSRQVKSCNNRGATLAGSDISPPAARRWLCSRGSSCSRPALCFLQCRSHSCLLVFLSYSQRVCPACLQVALLSGCCSKICACTKRGLLGFLEAETYEPVSWLLSV